ncbi:hypothetical protein ACFE04_028099 [Oxalis oulophora]
MSSWHMINGTETSASQILGFTYGVDLKLTWQILMPKRKCCCSRFPCFVKPAKLGADIEKKIVLLLASKGKSPYICFKKTVKMEKRELICAANILLLTNGNIRRPAVFDSQVA